MRVGHFLSEQSLLFVASWHYYKKNEQGSCVE